ncbi:hypothetical protein IMCC20628_01911 [Hoeflea sp. IMCC20628]|uniref:hypothetical protein n=1 Tax=Hoeflea sp. IMCC20628 TaxID=1620421 RepID=UPI00063AE7AA|nr:hypothetical protein [Hoeflea sp. IMCC20628]AKI00617.1 hypothetical protein IMCC20628_01911 [Hoeflea sp. IMCC20628]
MDDKPGQHPGQAPVSRWRIILAAVLDFCTAFFGFGYLVGLVSGEATYGGFQLSGFSALVAVGLIVVYFWIGSKYFGGTVWQWILKAR